jgi:1-phosphatidylinositol-3-phosphate 5-kinase
VDRQESDAGIIDTMRQYDFLKQMERVGKSSLRFVVRSEIPPIVEPPLYKARFTNATERYLLFRDCTKQIDGCKQQRYLINL